MQAPLTAIEMTGIIDDHQQLRLDGHLPIIGPMRVKVIVLYPATEKSRTRRHSFASLYGAFPEFGDLTLEDIKALELKNPDELSHDLRA